MSQSDFTPFAYRVKLSAGSLRGSANQPAEQQQGGYPEPEQA
jgi:hypothetical protein